MPLYEFYCKKCDKIEEEIVSYKNRNKKLKCSDCGSVMDRHIGSPSFQFVGDGFYQRVKEQRDADKEMEKIKKKHRKD